MQKIILDTNVIVSGLISSSIPTRILNELVLTREIELCISQQIINEYLEVLGRDKFRRFSNFKSKSDIVLNRIKDIAFFYKTEVTIEVLSDVSDNKFLELAVVSEADFLITGNINDFTFTEFKSTKILTPREYWDNYAPK